ncbi:MAG: hypothetical protein DWQ06_12280 [Calditrichaeota bacterium]|nr:MAG: hypothetical protein DWQ06_12280 [Calditrichota bacterium]
MFMPYKIISKIASGTFGTVYKAQESTKGEFYALKLIHENYKTPIELKRIKRGFETAQKVSHPNCVKMIEWYEEKDQIGFVMEFVDSVGNKNLCSLQNKISKIIQISNGLEALHSRGIIHRDLKPSNILEDKNGQIKITDFDLVKTQEASTITNSKSFLGTVKFSSPEQCKDSSKIDHRSDLYSLGIIFYKLLTNRFPFDGDSVTNIILGHIRTPLISPTQFNPEIPIEIENVVKKLLAKNRNDRFNSAKEVVEKLHVFLETPTETQIQTSSDFLLYPRFIGRENDFKKLEKSFSKTSERKPQFVLISGKSGSGKTQLWKEFKEGFSDRETLYLNTKCKENSTSLEPLREVLFQCLEILEGFSDNEKLPYFGNFCRDLEIILPQISQLSFFEKLPQTVKLSQEDGIFRLFEAVVTLLKNLQKEKILVLFFDDLQWADSQTTKFLHFLQNNFKNEKLLFAGTLRPNFSKSELKENFIENCSQIELESLTLGQVKEVLTSMLGQVEPVETNFAQLILEKTEGNPLFIQEIMFHLLEQKKIYKKKNKWVLSESEILSEELPKSIHSTITKRMEVLPKSVKNILQIASVIGKSFDFELLKILLPNLLEVEIQKALLKSCEENYLTSFSENYEFYHDSIRETLEKQIQSKNKIKFHKQIAKYLERKFDGENEDLILQLAHHFYEAKLKQKAKKYCLSASKVAEKKYSISNAIDFLTKAIELEVDKVKIISLTIKKALLMRTLGVPNEPLKIAKKAHKLSLELNDENLIVDSLLVVGNEEIQNFLFEEGFASLNEGLKISKKLGDETRLSKALFKLGQYYTMKGDFEESNSYCQKALKLAISNGLKELEMKVNFNIAVNFQNIWEFEKALKYLENSIELSKELKFISESIFYETSKGVILRNLGKLEESYNLFLKNLTKTQKYGFYEGIITATFGISNYFFIKANYSKSIPYLEKSISIAEKINDPKALLEGFQNYSSVQFLMGNFEKSNECLRKVWILANTSNTKKDFATYYKTKGLNQFAQKEFEASAESFSKSIPFRNNDYSVGGVLFLKANSLFELGDLESAQKENKQAKNLAEKVNDLQTITKSKILSLKIDFNFGLQKKALEGLLEITETEKNEKLLATALFEFCSLFAKNQNLTLLPGKKINFESYRKRTLELFRKLIQNDESFELKEKLIILENLKNESGIFHSGFLNSLVPLMEPETILSESVEYLTTQTQSNNCFIVLRNKITGKFEPCFFSKNYEDKEIDFSQTILEEAIRTNQSILVENALDSEKFKSNESIIGKIFLSVISVPFGKDGEAIGAIYLDRTNPENDVYQNSDLEKVKGIGKVLLPVIQKQNENLTLKIKSQIQELGIFIGNSPKMQKVYEEIENAANYNFPVYIFGETGTGKELVANALHKLSPRRNEPFVALNCSAIPKDLAESELFGHKKGAFTGATFDKKGVFELAENGTLLLDEVGDLSLDNQAKLLRVIQEKKLRVIGSEKTTKVNARILVATHKNLEEEVQKGNFREDLLHRLDVLKILVPPLRERIEDIPLLAFHILEKFNLESGKKNKGLSKDIIKDFENYKWKGNVRELENRIIKASVKKKKDVPLTLKDFDFLNPKKSEKVIQITPNESQNLNSENLINLVHKLEGETIYEKLATVEKAIITQALNEYNWNKTKVSAKLGISRMQINRIIARFNLVKKS